MMRAALVGTFSLALGAVAATAHADRRVFTHAFQYGTEAPGETSVMVWYSEARPAWDGSTATLRYSAQLQHGITEHYDASVYTTFAQTASGDASLVEPFGLDQVRLQNRYRFADRSEWPVDLQLQLDVAKQFGPSVYDLELRAVAAHDADKLTLAVNVAGLARLGHDTDRTFELGWAAAAAYEAHPRVYVGVEAAGLVDDTRAAVGPAVAVAASSKLWLAVTATLGLTDETDELTARAILGVAL